MKQHNKPVIFWPYLASCNYSRATINWYETNGVSVAPKDVNPPNYPNFRPIENFWSIVKGELKKKGTEVKTASVLHTKCNECAKTVD